MINLLNGQSFSVYGLVLQENAGLAPRPESGWVLLEQLEAGEDLTFLYRLDQGELLLELVDGIAFLSLAFKNDFSDLKTFLLDHKIILARPLSFCVQALLGQCRVRIWGRSETSQLIRQSPADLAQDALRYPVQLLPQFNILSVYTLFYQEKDRGFRFSGERHAFWELTYVDKAKIITEVDGHRFELKQGDALFYRPGQFHTQFTETGVAASFVTITFSMVMQDEAQISNRVFHLTREQADILKRILDEKDHPAHYSDDLILCYLKELIITLIRSGLAVNPVKTLENHLRVNVEHDIINRVITFVQTNLDQKITVADLAAEVHISPAYLSVLFKRRQGMTLIEYITTVKLEKSKDLIRAGQKNLTEIATELGFSSVHYFSRLFKNKYLISPSEYSRALH